MKKILSILLALFLVLNMTACQNEKTKEQDTSKQTNPNDGEKPEKDNTSTETPKGSMKAGTYNGKANGHNGSLELAVTVNDEKIEKIEIVESGETKTVANIAFETMFKNIIEHQTLEVDLVAGATVTSKAIVSSVEDALKQAEAKIDDFKKPIEKKKQDPIVLETDLVIVGGGGAGLSAALSAQEKGLKVILVEKNAMLGGHTALSGGLSLITGSKLQKEKYNVTEDTKESLYNDTMKNGGNKSVPEDLQLFVDIIGEASDWINDYVKTPAKNKLLAMGENEHDRVIAYEGAGAGLIDSLVEKAKTTDIDIQMNTKITSLIVEDRKVVGVTGETTDGTSVTIKAKATLLATGSYAANSKMLPEELQKYVYYGAQLAQGEGQTMAQNIGAGVVNQGYVELFENGVEWLPKIAKSTYNGSMSAWDKSGILVDRNGKRVVNERSAGINIVKEMAKQEDARLFLVMDEATYKHFEDNIAGYGITQEMLDNWFATDGKKVPYFAKGNTLEEAAKKLNINSEELKATVIRYNEFVKNGKDDDFGRDKKYLSSEINIDGAFYVIEQLPRFATTLGGLSIDKNLNVLDKGDKVIEGLYAAGDVAGGVRGNDSIPGGDVAWALASGYYAGRVISDILNK